MAVFVGNAWDPQEGREAPWVDIARQLAGDRGVELLGANAATTPPGTEALGRVFAAAGAPALVLFDEVLNFVNRYRQMADPFHAFIQNLTVAMTGTTHGAAVISLPRSQVEKIVEFVGKGDFGLGSGRRPDGRFERLSFKETVSPEDVMFDADVYLLARALAARLKTPPAPEHGFQQPFLVLQLQPLDPFAQALPVSPPVHLQQRGLEGIQNQPQHRLPALRLPDH